jgi:hypothetical protein
MNNEIRVELKNTRTGKIETRTFDIPKTHKQRMDFGKWLNSQYPEFDIAKIETGGFRKYVDLQTRTGSELEKIS